EEERLLLQSKLRVAEAWLGDAAMLPWIALGEPNIFLGGSPSPLPSRLAAAAAAATTATEVAAANSAAGAAADAATAAEHAAIGLTDQSKATAAAAEFVRTCSRNKAAAAAAAAAATGLVPGLPAAPLEDIIPLLGNIKWLRGPRWPPLCLSWSDSKSLQQTLTVTTDCAADHALFAALLQQQQQQLQQQQQQLQQQQQQLLQIRGVHAANVDNCLNSQLLAVPCDPKDPDQW
ncbi:hypothetical protein, conserved, partial [Eimeria tenella]